MTRIIASNPRTIVLASDDLRAIVSRARENDPATMFRAAKRLAERAIVMRSIGRDRLACVALEHARAALRRALDLRGGVS